jgi:hypothetical protein
MTAPTLEVLRQRRDRLTSQPSAPPPSGCPACAAGDRARAALYRGRRPGTTHTSRTTCAGCGRVSAFLYDGGQIIRRRVVQADPAELRARAAADRRAATTGRGFNRRGHPTGCTCSDTCDALGNDRRDWRGRPLTASG